MRLFAVLFFSLWCLAGVSLAQAVPATGKGVVSWLSKAIISSPVGKTVVSGVVAGGILCSAFTGCDVNSNQGLIVDVLTSEDTSTQNKFSQYVDFEIDGYVYQLYIEETDSGALLVELDDEELGRLIFLEQFAGDFLDDHHYVGEEIYFLDEISGREVYLNATVERVTETGYVDSLVHSYTDVLDGSLVFFTNPYNRLVHEAILVDDGGFEFY